jgi:uncharacterized membrane protein YbhN (UPF0104 family)
MKRFESDLNIVAALRWVGTFLTLVLFIYLLQKQNWGTIWNTFQKLSIGIVILVWLLLLARLVLNSVRWFVLLKTAEIDIPFSECIKLVLLGMFVSNFLPSTVGGDGVRLLSLLRFEEDRSLAFSTIIIDRMINVLAMLILLPVSFIVFDLSFLVSVSFIKYKGSFFTWFINLFQRIINKTKSFLSGFSVWLNSPRKLMFSVCISWSAIFIYFLSIWILAVNLGMSVKFYQVIGVTVITYLITLLPISINGYGLREVTITGLYSYLGASLEAAISLAIISRLLYLSTTLIGAIWLPENITYLGKTVE